MNPLDQSLTRIGEIVSKGSAGVIVIPVNPTADAIAAATSLYLALSKLGKSINLAGSTSVQSDLVASDKFQSNLSTSGDHLVISFPYAEGAIDKVDYNIQGSSFNLIVAPRQGRPKLDPSQVKFTYTGGKIDFIITIDTPNLNNLGAIYNDNQNQFQGKEIINIDRHLTNGFFGTVNFVNKTSSSTTELIYKIINQLNIEMDRDMASNLYAGLAAATNNFTSYSVNADTFELAANLLKAGAVKKIIRQPVPSFNQPNLPVQPMNRPMVNNSFNPPMNQPPQNVPISPNVPNVQNNQQPLNTNDNQNNNQTPQDWLKPKIFRGGGGLL
jgi:hypothetical protein